jgi:hypothetical protein
MKGVTRTKNERAIGLRNGDKGTELLLGGSEDKVKLAWITRGGWCTAVHGRGLAARRFSTVSKRAVSPAPIPYPTLSHAGVDRRTKGGNTDLP